MHGNNRDGASGIKYRKNLEEMEVPGHLGAGVLDGHELVEGDDDELGALVVVLALPL